ncbi:hypothetical protein Sta7437_2079 [Stanieria cyanosphaera PCC 7437]|uniref:Uncharacterized protein n=1 Tax=Stanieria cyanosphaera (strain ATCC 29371 / PCC 7437) TaxID=111780 RepID=K9XSQ1_STAC7|nr:hypothetical protein [Stanieria cyanosphaera]AFZ35630.1 hypothetical protein Sta7437_2079 [Stanieria cyanosphaera PCC 7437]
MKTKALLISVSVMAALMPTSIALADLNPNSEKILTRMIDRTASKQLAGYIRPKAPIIGQAAEGGVFSKTFRLQANKNYGFVAVCSKPKCSDVDLVVLNSKGQEVTIDQSDSPQAVVKLKPKTTDAYKVEVEMYSCTEPKACALGIGAYKK